MGPYDIFTYIAYPSDSAGPDPREAIWLSGSGADFSWQSWRPGIKIKTWSVTSLTHFKPCPLNAQMISQASSHGLNHGQRAPSSGTCQTAPWMHTWLFRVLFSPLVEADVPWFVHADRVRQRGWCSMVWPWDVVESSWQGRELEAHAARTKSEHISLLQGNAFGVCLGGLFRLYIW